MYVTTIDGSSKVVTERFQTHLIIEWLHCVISAKSSVGCLYESVEGMEAVSMTSSNSLKTFSHHATSSDATKKITLELSVVCKKRAKSLIKSV